MQNNQKIPKGWSVKKLGEISCLIAGNAFNSEDFIDMGIPLIRISNIADDGIVLDENTAFLPESFLKENSKFVIRQTDLLIAMSGATTGKMGINTFSEPMLLNQRVCIIRAKDVSQNFLNQYLFTHKKDILRQSYGGAQPNIGNNDIKKIKVLLPPLPEQEKIALVLGTWDEAIEKLSNLIEQKKLLKKGLMQKLLTGQTRLPSFTQPWKDIELSDLLNYEQPSKYLVGEILPYDKNKIPVLTANKAFILGSTDDSSGIYTQGDCIIFDDFTTDIKYVNFPFKVKSSAIKILTPKTNTNLKFVYEQMKCIKYPLAGHKRYYLSEYQYITISIPDISEQQAIADVLSTADDEINLLNQKLEALKEQKKGLMQQLLTGQIRVKVN